MERVRLIEASIANYHFHRVKPLNLSKRWFNPINFVPVRGKKN
jgi:hypothetical protein